MVVADHERDRGLSRERDAELARGAPHVWRLGRDGRDGLMEVEVRTTGGSRRDDEAGDAEPHSDPADQRRA